MATNNIDPRTLLIGRIVEQIKPLLAGHDPEVQGAVLADLLALFIAGHHPALRHEIMEQTVGCARNLIEPNEKMIFEGRPKPEGWDRQ